MVCPITQGDHNEAHILHNCIECLTVICCILLSCIIYILFCHLQYAALQCFDCQIVINLSSIPDLDVCRPAALVEHFVCLLSKLAAVPTSGPLGMVLGGMWENPNIIRFKSAPSLGGSGPNHWAKPLPVPKWHLYWQSYFWSAHGRDQQTTLLRLQQQAMSSQCCDVV